jgi:transcriptional regulator of heat shock response
MKEAIYRERKDRILGIVVNSYIKTVTPVSSSYIVDEHQLDLSPATIRNILAELEEDGFLTHPHTSAGRLPTQEGYRYYVDNLMNEIQLLEEEKFRIKKEYAREMRDLEGILEKTSQVVSDLTHYTSIISVDGWDGKIICRGTSYVVGYPDYQDVKKIGNILFALEEKESLLQMINRDIEQRIKIYIGHEFACGDIDGCSLAVSSYQAHSGPTGRIAVLGPTRMDYSRVVSTLNYLTKLVGEIV